MKSLLQTDSVTILLEGTIEKPTSADMERVEKIRQELKAKHDGQGGKIVHQSSKRSGYRQLKISWVSDPKLVSNEGWR